jgi:hypothetical protein
MQFNFLEIFSSIKASKMISCRVHSSKTITVCSPPISKRCGLISEKLFYFSLPKQFSSNPKSAKRQSPHSEQGCHIFSWCKIPKRENIYQMTIKYSAFFRIKNVFLLRKNALAYCNVAVENSEVVGRAPDFRSPS